MDRSSTGGRRWTRARNAVSALRAFQRPYSKVDNLPTSRLMSTEPLPVSLRKRSKKGCIALSACLVFVAAVAVIGTAVGVTESKKHNNNNGDDSDADSISSVSSICSRTLYPDVCNSTLADSTREEYVAKAMKAAMAGIRKSILAVESLQSSSPVRNGTQYSTLEMCKEVLTDSLEQVNASLSLMNTNVTTMKLADVQQYMAAALTYQDTCVDGVQHFGLWNASNGDAVYGAHATFVTRLLSNALSLVNSIAKVTDWGQVLRGHSRRLLQEEDSVQEEVEVPHWVNRRLLQQANPAANAVVAKDGSGKFTSIQAAVDAAPTSGVRWVIYVKKGVYNEYVSIPKKHKNLMMYGDGPGATVITGSKSVKGSGVTTFLSATFAVVAPGFIMKDMTIQNTAGAAGEQAVALRAGGDQQAFSNVNLEGYQDTLYAHALRQFYTGCTILGTIDYIFGNAAAVFQNCNLQARLGRSGSQNIYTASGRTDPGQNTGFSFLSCTVGAAPGLPASYPTYLGRPWKPYAQTVFIKSNLGSIVNPAGWLLWNGDPNSGKSVSYGEYGNTGPGANTGSRVSWSRQISIADANKFTVSSFIAGQQWLPATSLPFNAAL